MRVTTTDPITGNSVKSPDAAPFVIEGSGPDALKIYFESEESKSAYLEIETEHPGRDFTTNLSNPQSMGGDTKK